MTKQRTKKTTGRSDGPETQTTVKKPASSTIDQSTSSLSLRTKYFSIVPLHITFIQFAVFYLPRKMLVGEQASPLAAGGGSAQNENSRPGWVACLVDEPVKGLLLVNLAVLLIQIWFTIFLNSWKASLNSSSAASSSSLNSRPSSASFIDRVWKTYNQVQRGQVDPRARHLFNQSWLIMKESALLNLILTIIINLVIILLGSSTSSFDLVSKNFLLASLIAILSFFPATVLLGWNQGRQKLNWIRIFSSFQPKSDLEVALLCPAFGTCLGAWLGAIPIPLDWDRPWQTWPITCLVGASLGHAVGSVASMIWCGLLPV